MSLIRTATLALVAVTGFAALALAQPAASPEMLVDQHARNNAPGTGRVGEWYRGAGDKGGRSDWKVQLDQGVCYWLVTSGVDPKGGTDIKMSLYLWDLGEKRLTDMKSKDNNAMVTHCPTVTGMYHVQAKILKGEGSYSMAVYAKGAPPAAPPPPPAPPAPPYDYLSEMNNQIAATTPGAKIQGGILKGSGSSIGSDDKIDFPVVMEQGKCYTVIAIGHPKQVENLSLYIWGPNNKRITESRDSKHATSLAHCPTMTGSHKVQVKVSGGKGEFAVGIYSK